MIISDRIGAGQDDNPELAPYTLVSDRSAARYEGSGWLAVGIEGLKRDYVEKLLREEYDGDAVEGLDADDWSLLELPFFLDIAVSGSNPKFATRSAAIRELLAQRVHLADAKLDSLAAVAFEILASGAGLSVDADRLARHVGTGTVLSMLNSGVLVPAA